MSKFFKLIIYILIIYISPCEVYSSDFALTASSGYSYRLMTLHDSATSEYESYFKKRKQGININLEAIWFSDNRGVGLGFTSFLNSVSGKNIHLSENETADISDNVRINYFSIQFHNRWQIRESRFWGDANIGLGLVRYRNEQMEYESKSLIKGKTYGLNAGLSSSCEIFRHIHFFISASFFTAALSDWERDGYFEQLDPKEGLTRLDFNAGIRVEF